MGSSSPLLVPEGWLDVDVDVAAESALVDPSVAVYRLDVPSESSVLTKYQHKYQHGVVRKKRGLVKQE